MIAFKCKMCGGELSITEGSNVCECEFCGTQQTIPSADNEKKVNLFNRANRLRMNAEFDKAAAVYASITAEFPEEAEAYWGLCLCKYGIEYVDDPLTGNKIPTCHRTLPESIMDDSDFDQACENADAESKRLYREEAKAIDRLQQDILSIVASEDPFDVFICYKETDEDGERTDDSVLAQDIYDFLTEKGLKVFFARITLEDKLGKQYEPYIYAALHSAKVMLAVGTKYEYYDAVWVKNEWARYLDMMRSDKSKTLIPCFKGIDAYDMPREFKNLQALDMGKIGWQQDLVRGIKKLTATEEKRPPQSQPQYMASGSNVENLMKRARLFMEDGDFENANDYLDKVLDENAEYAPAYIAKVCTAFGFHHEEDLGKADRFFVEDGNWKKAMRFATSEQRKTYEGYVAEVLTSIINLDLPDFDTVEQCDMARKALAPYMEFEGVSDLIEDLDKLQEQILAHEQRLINAEDTKKALWDQYQEEKETNKNKIREISIQQQRKLREITNHLEAVEENIRQLTIEELSIKRGFFAAKQRDEVANRRLELRKKLDELKSQYNKADTEMRERIRAIEQELPDEAAVRYEIAKVYYDNALYEEAAIEYYRIIDYKDVRDLIGNDEKINDAVDNLKEKSLRISSIDKIRAYQNIFNQQREKARNGYDCKAVDDYMTEIFIYSIAYLTPEQKQHKAYEIPKKTFPIVETGYKQLEIRDILGSVSRKLFGDGMKEEIRFIQDIKSSPSMVEVWNKWKQYGLDRKYHDLNRLIANYKEEERIGGNITKNIDNKKNEIVTLVRKKV